MQSSCPIAQCAATVHGSAHNRGSSRSCLSQRSSPVLTERRRRHSLLSAIADSSNGSPPPQEKFIDPSIIVQEARAKSNNFVFEYDEQDEEEDEDMTLNLFEQRMAEQAAAAAEVPAAAAADMPLTAQTADVLSAYSAEQGFKEISVQDLAALRDTTGSGIALLDVRTPEEYGNGHAVGAVNVPLDQLTAAVKGGQLPAADAQIALICQSGRRSAQAAVKLTKVHGFSDVVNVQGGTLAWISAGLPTDT